MAALNRPDGFSRLFQNLLKKGRNVNAQNQNYDLKSE
jgi:hypothetical protein